MFDKLYKSVLKPVFFRFDPEDIHEFMVYTGELLGKTALTRWMTGLFFDYHGTDISKTVDGITYRTPFLLSAGFDYNAHLTQILSYVGFGGEEVGSVTAKPCEGNRRPRLTRLPRSQSILVNKGLRNDGVEAVIQRLKQFQRYPISLKPRFVVGISIARTNCTDAADIQTGIDDYLYSLKRLNEENVGDYYTINISCPNSFGGESFITPELLEKLLSGLDVEFAKAFSAKKPIYIKMPINIPWDQFEGLLKVIDAHKLQGVIIGNLNKDYNSLDFRNEAPAEYCGGLSGKPCAKLSTELIKKTRELYGKRFTIIGVGGVISVETAKEKFDAGADLVQLITGMIYEGPGLIKKLCEGVTQKP